MMLTLLTLLAVVVSSASGGKKSRRPNLSSGGSGNQEDYDADVFCRSQTRLIKMDKSDEITVVDTVPGNSVLLQCKFCEERDNGLPRTWSKQRHIFTGNITEMITSMDNNCTFSDIFITRQHSLVLRYLKEKDLGMYICKAPYVNTLDKSFNYLIDFKCKTGDDLRGRMASFKNYSTFFMSRANEQIANQSYLTEPGTYLKVITEWGDWTECEPCIQSESLKFRFGKCRVKFFFKNCTDYKTCIRNYLHTKRYVFDNQNTDAMAGDEDVSDVADKGTVTKNIVELGISLACRSYLLKILNPTIYDITSPIPDFIYIGKCNEVCKGLALRGGPRYRKSIVLAKGAHLTLVCPDSTIDSEIVWEHNKAPLHSNEGTDYVAGTTEPRVYVDSFNTLYLFDVTETEAGNYTCYVDGLRMQEVKIVVLTRSLFFTKEFTRHLKYLGMVFVICFFAYVAGIGMSGIKFQIEKKKLKKASGDKQRLLDGVKAQVESELSS